MELLFWSSLHWYAHLPMHHVLWITFTCIGFCTAHSNVWTPSLLTCTWIWIGCMLAVAIVDIWSAYKAIQYVPKGSRMKLANYHQNQSYGIRWKQYHCIISGSLGSTAGCEQFVQTWEGTCASLSIGNM